MKLLYLNVRAWRVRIAQAAIWLGAGLCLWLAFLAPPNPADQPIDQIIASVLAALMVCAALAFEVYLRLYVLRIELDSGVLLVTTLATLHHRRVRLEGISTSLGETRQERAHAFPGLGAGNSWRGLKAEGHILPFIVDTTAHDDR